MRDVLGRNMRGILYSFLDVICPEGTNYGMPALDATTELSSGNSRLISILDRRYPEKYRLEIIHLGDSIYTSEELRDYYEYAIQLLRENKLEEAMEYAAEKNLDLRQFFSVDPEKHNGREETSIILAAHDLGILSDVNHSEFSVVNDFVLDEMKLRRIPFFLFGQLLQKGKQGEAIKLIKEQKLDVNRFYFNQSLIGGEGNTLLTVAAYYGATEVVRFILNSSNVSPAIITDTMPEQMRQRCIKHINPHFRGYTALMCGANHIEVVKELLKSEHIRSTIDREAVNGQTAISIAVGSNNVECVKALVNAGAKVGYLRLANFCLQTKKAETLLYLTEEGKLKLPHDILHDVYTAVGINNFYGVFGNIPTNDRAIIFGAKIVSYLMSQMLKKGNLEGNNLVLQSEFSFISSRDLFVVSELLTKFDAEHTQHIYEKDFPNMSPELLQKIKFAVADMIDEKSTVCKIKLTHAERIEVERMGIGSREKGQEVAAASSSCSASR